MSDFFGGRVMLRSHLCGLTCSVIADKQMFNEDDIGEN